MTAANLRNLNKNLSQTSCVILHKSLSHKATIGCIHLDFCASVLGLSNVKHRFLLHEFM